MNRLQLAIKIMNIVFAFDAAVFGGYVRDVIIRKETEFNDLDILWPLGTHDSFAHFMRIIQLDHTVVSVPVIIPYGAKYRAYKLVIDDLAVDCCFVDMTIEDWQKERVVDLSCNLFWKSRAAPLSVRYIPSQYEFSVDPIQDMIEHVQDKKCFNIIEIKGHKEVARAERRRAVMINNDWNIMNV